jgi:hypothetical protein
MDPAASSSGSIDVFVLESADPLCPDFRRNFCALVAIDVRIILYFSFIYGIASVNLKPMIKLLQRVL